MRRSPNSAIARWPALTISTICLAACATQPAGSDTGRACPAPVAYDMPRRLALDAELSALPPETRRQILDYYRLRAALGAPD